MPEVMQRRTFGDAYEVQLTNDRVSGYWAWIFRKDGTSDKLRMKSKEHYADVLSRVVDGRFSEQDKPTVVEPAPVVEEPVSQPKRRTKK